MILNILFKCTIQLSMLIENIFFQEMAFSIEERQSLGIHGLLPPRVKTQDEQVKHALANIERFSDDLNKYIYLMGLQVSMYDSDLILMYLSTNSLTCMILAGEKRKTFLQGNGWECGSVHATRLHTNRWIGVSKVWPHFPETQRTFHIHPWCWSCLWCTKELVNKFISLFRAKCATIIRFLKFFVTLENLIILFIKKIDLNGTINFT